MDQQQRGLVVGYDGRLFSNKSVCLCSALFKWFLVGVHSRPVLTRLKTIKEPRFHFAIPEGGELNGYA